MATYLDAILSYHRARAERDDRVLVELIERAEKSPPTRDLKAALTLRRPDLLLAPIAEIKRRSPVRGEFDPDLDPAVVANDYERGGAAALSVLTDAPHFGGSAEDLAAARRIVHVPVLRKDFTVSEADVADARIMGADAVLLIVAALSGVELEVLLRRAGELGLEALVEVHDEAELERALGAGAQMIGVNQRDLHTFQVDAERALRVGAAMPSEVVKVAESGIRTRRDVEGLAAAGFHAALVGEALVTAPERAEALRLLFGASIGELA